MINMAKKTSFLKLVKSCIPVNKTDRVKTASCFKKGFVYRDSNIDSFMTEYVSASEKGLVVCHELTEVGHTFMEMAHELLSIDIKNRTHSKTLIAKTLIESGNTFSLKQVEDLHKRFVDGETEIGFLANGYANFFFVHDDKGHVFVLSVNLSSVGWYVLIRKFNRSCVWRRERRLFSREPNKNM